MQHLFYPISPPQILNANMIEQSSNPLASHPVVNLDDESEFPENDFEILEASPSSNKRKYEFCWHEHFVHDLIRGKIICKYCHISYKHGKDGSTLNFLRHIVNKHTDRYTSNVFQSTLNIVVGNLAIKFSFDNELAQIDYVLTLIANEKPFTKVENTFMSNFFKTWLQPHFLSFSRGKAIRITFDQFEKKKTALISSFQSLKYWFALFADGWHGNNGEDYIVVTANWLDNLWIMQKRVLAFRPYDTPHTSAQIAQLITSVSVEYGIIERIFSIALDNASNNSNAISGLKSSINPPLGGVFFSFEMYMSYFEFMFTRCFTNI